MTLTGLSELSATLLASPHQPDSNEPTDLTYPWARGSARRLMTAVLAVLLIAAFATPAGAAQTAQQVASGSCAAFEAGGFPFYDFIPELGTSGASNFFWDAQLR